MVSPESSPYPAPSSSLTGANPGQGRYRSSFLRGTRHASRLVRATIAVRNPPVVSHPFPTPVQHQQPHPNPTFELRHLHTNAYHNTDSGCYRCKTHLVKIDNWLPELVLQLVKIPHSDLPKVSRMVFVEIRAVVVRTTGHTATTGMLAVLAYTSMSGGHMATAL